jgi:hypothetical protein
MAPLRKHVLRCDSSDRLASLEENEQGTRISIIVIAITSQDTSTSFVLPGVKTTSSGPHAFFQVTNRRKVSFANVAQPVSRATVAAVMHLTWRYFSHGVGFHCICLALKSKTFMYFGSANTYNAVDRFPAEHKKQEVLFASKRSLQST